MGILGQLWVKLGLKSEEFSQGLNKAKSQTNDFSSKIAGMAKRMAAVFSIQQVVSFSHEVTELANKAAGVKKAFDKLNSPTLLAQLRQATSGTVDDLQLMQKAVQAKNFNIPVENLATYLKFASQRARETGQSVDYLVDSIITGLGRQSVMILDNLGISAAEIKDNMKEGATMAEAVGKIISEQMKSAETEIDKAALATDRLTASWTNFKIALGSDTSTQGVWGWVKGTTSELLNIATLFLQSGMSFKDALMLTAGTIITNPVTGDLDAITNSLNNSKVEGTGAGTQPSNKGETTTQEIEQTKGIINLLNEEIKKKQQIRDLSENEDEIHKLNTEIAALKEKLEVLQMTEMEYAKVAELLSGQIPVVNKIFDVPALEENIEQGRSLIDTAYAELANKGAEMADLAIKQQETLSTASSMFVNAMNTGITGALGELGKAIAGVEGSDVGSVMKSLLSPLADACISIGMLILGTGQAISALTASLMNPFTAPLSIGAGIALIAIGVAAKAGLAAIGKGKSLNNGIGTNTSYSGGNSYTNWGTYSNESYAMQSINLTGVLHGQDIYLSVEKTKANNRR